MPVAMHTLSLHHDRNDLLPWARVGADEHDWHHWLQDAAFRSLHISEYEAGPGMHAEQLIDMCGSGTSYDLAR